MPELPFSRVEIIQRCNEAGTHGLVSSEPYGNRVIKFSEGVVVKFGIGVQKYEARSQENAYKILDHNIVRVPKVYDFFEDSQGCGYLVMEFMEGRVHALITEPSQLHSLYCVLEHFATRKSQKPGVLGGGPSFALLFGESDHPTFETVEQMEQWFNRRLLVQGSGISFGGSELVLCHLDLFPRNILWHPNRPPCILDWSSAGYYPKIFESCSQIIRKRLENSNAILDIPISAVEMEQVSLILRAWGNIQRYSFSRSEGRSERHSWPISNYSAPVPIAPPSPHDS